MKKMLKRLGVVIPSTILTLLMAVGFSTPAFAFVDTTEVMEEPTQVIEEEEPTEEEKIPFTIAGKPQFNVLRKLLRSKKFDYVVNACDAGREGEAIFRRVYALAGSKLPIKRLWISSMEDAAIQQGFENLRDGAAYDNLFAASECRAKADWLIGMNGTRAFTKKYGRKQTMHSAF